MAWIVVSENVTLDGVVEDPTGDEGFERGGWFGRLGGPELAEWAQVEFEEAQQADALLLGRGTDAYFGRRWNDREGEWADCLNGLPKYVVSSTVDEAQWANSTVLKGDVVEQVSKLKRRLDGEIVVYASRPLVQTLFEHDLVDEVRLILFPVVLGAGERLFGETSERKPLRLVRTRPVGERLTQLTYEVVRSNGGS
jgi:dihydrofolate reductase